MTTITPPFTGSYASTLQGTNVSRFDMFGMSVAPKMGRSGARTFLSSSSGIVDVSPDVTTFFDDSIRRSKPIVEISGSITTANVEIISDDEYKIQQLPSYRLSQQTFGIEDTFDSAKVFYEMDPFESVSYIRDPTIIAYPLVIEQTSFIDPFSFAGAIEPFPIRKEIAGNSTFIGSQDDPEPTGVKGTLTAGGHVLDSKNRSVFVTNFYTPGHSTSSPFVLVPVDVSEELFVDPTVFALEMPYVSEDGEDYLPFIDGASVESAYRNISNAEIRNALESSARLVDLPSGYPGGGEKSMPCGFEYQNSRGIDSIAYGGLLK